MQIAVEIVIAVLSVIVLWRATPRLFRLVRSPDTQGQALSLLVLISGTVLSDTIWLRSIPAFKLLVLAGFAFIALLSLAQRKVRDKADPRGGGPLVLGFAIWLWLFIVNIAENTDIGSTAALLSRLAPGFVWILIFFVWKNQGIRREIIASIATVTLAAIGLTVPFFGSNWRACDEFKCGVLDGMLLGPFVSENYLAQQAVMTVVIGIAVYGWRASFPLVLLSLAFLLATESRSAQIAFVLALVVGLVFGRKVRKNLAGQQSPSRILLPLLIPGAFIATGLYLMFTAIPSDFSNRGAVWINARELILQKPIAGRGIDRWEYLQGIGEASNHYPHSVYVFLFFCGGAIGLLLFFFLSRASFAQSFATEDSMFPGLLIGVTFLTLSLMEVTWNPNAIDGFFWFALAFISSKGTSPSVFGEAPTWPHPNPKAIRHLR